ncbi:MAG: TIGR00282 family metallophosphoesterase [Acidobacteria bacterium]|nr:TIGR00282 family metallophosphoesterase [Acidobacteriota bacterium]
MNILCIGDVMGRVGRRILRDGLAELQKKYSIHFTVANAENAAGGFGLTPETARELLSYNIDVLTSGNHIWDRQVIIPYFEQSQRVLRPHNFPPDSPGTGAVVVPAGAGRPVAVLNLQGRAFMQNIDCPFRAADEVIPQLREETPVVVVDFHAEATAEKLAMGRYLDGRVSVVFGTHTHVQTADEQLLPGLTGYITDLGMTGPHDSVIGMEVEGSVARFLQQRPVRLSPAKGNPRFNGLVVEIDADSGKCLGVERVNFAVSF